MPTNDFIGFASSGSANVVSQADYAAAAEQGIGMQPGPASSKLANKVWRQGANMAAALGRIAAVRGYDALDNGDLNALQSSLDDTISVGTFNRMYFSQTSGSYTAPRTGVYRITLKGGGGGGGGRSTSHTYTGGSGGGEGGTLIFYVTLTKSQSYAYTIGAGGAAGTDGASPTLGDNGGVTKFVLSGGASYQVNGGDGGAASWNQTKPGGRGSFSFSAPSGAVCHFIPGAPGMPGAGIGSGTSLTDFPFYAAMGGGNGGGCAASGQVAIYGGGGAGASGASGTPPAAQNGGDGYILIEYAG